jgi:hypothetical protein
MTRENPVPDPHADQQAAAGRERDRQLRAFHDGEEVTVRTITVVTSPSELEALERGEDGPGIQAQIDRQLAKDEVIAAIEAGL